MYKPILILFGGNVVWLFACQFDNNLFAWFFIEGICLLFI
jgi:hypothetical protein